MASAKYSQHSLRPGKVLLSKRFSPVQKTILVAALDLVFAASMVASPKHMSWLTEDQKKDLEGQHMQQFHKAFAHLTKLYHYDEYFSETLYEVRNGIQ